MTNTKPTQCKWRIRRHYRDGTDDWDGDLPYNSEAMAKRIANTLNTNPSLQHIHHTVERVEESEDAE